MLVEDYFSPSLSVVPEVVTCSGDHFTKRFFEDFSPDSVVSSGFYDSDKGLGQPLGYSVSVLSISSS